MVCSSSLGRVVYVMSSPLFNITEIDVNGPGDPGAVGALLAEKGLTLALAESCTGGMISAGITGVPGSSGYYTGGVVAYHNRVKKKLLGVSARDLELYGAVSSQVAEAMARGVKELLGVDIGLAVTGIAGPGGGSVEKPVGLVYIGLSAREGTTSREMRLAGSREHIRRETVRASLEILRVYLSVL